jgi:hypothetical protein
LIVANEAAVEGIEPAVLIRGNAVILAVQLEGAVFDAVGVAAYDGT